MEYDWHIHTVFSPCAARDMEFSAIVAKALERGLRGVGFTDHPFRRGLAKHHLEIDEYRKKLYAPIDIFIGAELEVAGPGRLVIDPEDLPVADYIIAAPSHYNVLQEEPVENMSDARQWSERLLMDFRNVLGSGADIIAHPFHVYSLQYNLPAGIGFPPLGDVLKLMDRERLRGIMKRLAEEGVALEISRRAHSDPALRSFLEGVFLEYKEYGGKFSLGSDAHSLDRVGVLGSDTENILAAAGVSREDLWETV